MEAGTDQYLPLRQCRVTGGGPGRRSQTQRQWTKAASLSDNLQYPQSLVWRSSYFLPGPVFRRQVLASYVALRH